MYKCVQHEPMFCTNFPVMNTMAFLRESAKEGTKLHDELLYVCKCTVQYNPLVITIH